MSEERNPGAGGQFGILAPATMPQEPSFASGEGVDLGSVGAAERSSHGGGGGALSGRIVAEPPDLEAWREKLFNVDDMIVLTNEQ